MNVNVTNAIDLGTTDTGNLAAVKTAVESTAGQWLFQELNQGRRRHFAA